MDDLFQMFRVQVPNRGKAVQEIWHRNVSFEGERLEKECSRARSYCCRLVLVLLLNLKLNLILVYMLWKNFCWSWNLSIDFRHCMDQCPHKFHDQSSKTRKWQVEGEFYLFFPKFWTIFISFSLLKCMCNFLIMFRLFVRCRIRKLQHFCCDL